MEPEPPPAPVPPQANPAIQVLGSIVGAVAGTIITSNLGGSPTGNLIAAVLGAAIAPFATYVGPKRHVRLGVTLAAIAIGLFLTYGGVALFDAAADKETFPSPIETPTPTSTPSPRPTTAPGPDDEPIETIVEGIGIRVTPRALRCTAERCHRPVTIESIGSRELRTTGIEFTDGPDGLFRRDIGCDALVIERGAPCTFSVRFAGTADERAITASLVIHQNLDGPPTVVKLQGSGPAGETVGDLSVTSAQCTIEPGPLIRVTATVAATGAITEAPAQVTLADGATKDVTLTPGEPQTIDVGPVGEPSASLPAKIVLDADNVIPEDSEDNNEREILTCVSASSR